MGSPRVFDGRTYVDVPDAPRGGTPPPPVADGDGTVFVSIASYRDGERCAETLKSLFENAAHPEKIIVGLSEQVFEEDPKCVELFCKAYGARLLTRQRIRDDMTKVIHLPDQDQHCPYLPQIRLVATFHTAARGPVWARSLVRKVLGNEEYCMQVDAHTRFIKGWDVVAKEEWKLANNEYAVISHPPAVLADRADYESGGSKAKQVPRACHVAFKSDNGFPDYTYPVFAWAEDLEKPLLGNAWSSAFSFAKCHLEESAPYDSFSWYAKSVEQFSRFSRFWTRGYDVYTPTRTIAFHDSGVQANGHGKDEWFRNQRQRFRLEAIDRAKAPLGLRLQDGSVASATAQANLGLYGLGRRRTLPELEAFANVDLARKAERRDRGSDDASCADLAYVPFDAAISPVENLHSEPDDLDPQPEYPLRTKLLFYEQVELGGPVEVKASPLLGQSHVDSFQRMDGLETPNLPPFSTLLVLWIFGMVVWCIVFMNPGHGVGHGKPKKKEKQRMYKDV